MSLVLCVTRGGDRSIRVENAAIALAKNRGDSLVFLYIADISFLNKIAVGVIRRCAEREMVKMGRFILTMAVERALAGSVKAKAVVRTGKPREVLPRVVNEMKVSTVVLECSAGETRMVEGVEMDRLHSITQ